MSHRVRARGPVDVDATVFGGSDSASYGSCNGHAGMSAKYAGLGAEVRANPFAPAEERDGFSVTAGAAAATGRFLLLECSGDCVGFDPTRFPRQHWLGGGYARMGNDWRYFGFQVGGILMAEHLHPPGDFSWRAPIPDLYLRIGRLDSFHVDIGHYNPTTVFRPGLHAGLNFVPAPQWLVALHGGVGLRWGLDELGGHADLELRTPVTDNVQVGLAGGLSDGLHHVEYDVRSLIGLRF